MKFLVDAQLPKQLSQLLVWSGHEALHTLDLPLANRTSDEVISELSVKDHWVVVTKDSDFVDSFLLRKEPWKLLLVSTGNIQNTELIAIFVANIRKISVSFEDFDFIEINRFGIVYHV